jgi:HEPN domain-containing protein
MSAVIPSDRLYELLPVYYRQKDVEQGHPLRDLLRAIAEQVQLVEDDIAQLYENWFVETAEEWLLPYIGDLAGYEIVPAAGLAPRADIANYVRAKRKRGTLAALESLANDSGGFPARAVEFFTILARSQSLGHLRQDRGRVADLRDLDALDLIDSPFDVSAHSLDLRGVNAKRHAGWHNIPNAAAHLWRLRSYPVTHAPAYYLQRGSGYFFYTFSVLGNDAPLFTNPIRESDPTSIAGELNVPKPIRRRAFETHLDDYYGLNEDGSAKSVVIWFDDEEQPVPASDIIAADLSDWRYRPPAGKIAVDPKLGRFAMARDRDTGVSVTFHHGFSADIGASEAARRLTQPRKAVLYRVGAGEQFTTIGAARDRWIEDQQPHAVIEIADSGVYSENVEFDVPEHATLQLRAANRTRPVIAVLDSHPSRGEALHVTLHHKSRFTLDGILLAGRPLQIEGAGETPPAARVLVRRCTLVPGWMLGPNCDPTRPAEASIDVRNLSGSVTIDHSITGSIAVMNETAESEPLALELRDSILDATSNALEAVMGPGGGYAWATMRILSCTVFGRVLTHAIALAENSIFDGEVRVARRQIGCVRFCYVAPGSRTPRRYHCQPDLADAAARELAKKKNENANERVERERRRVAPRFSSIRYGAPDYCQLAFDCAEEIARGADDESEMGAFHEVHLPQRIANLRARLDDSTPAGMETGIILAD